MSAGTFHPVELASPDLPPSIQAHHVPAMLQGSRRMALLHRFVGLLLVTKLLPAGDEGTIRAVHDAIGSRFISRLLLPLHASQAWTVGHFTAPCVPYRMHVPCREMQARSVAASSVRTAVAVAALASIMHVHACQDF